MSSVKSPFGKKKKQSQDMALQITSMADIFMILLVFLLKSYSSSISSAAPTGKTKLPVASSSETMKDTLKLEISPDAIIIDQKPIVTLKDFAFEPGELPEHGLSGPLYRVLFEQRKHLPEPNLDSNLMVLADERAPYSTIERVIASAAGAGFVDLQLVVVQNQ